MAGPISEAPSDMPGVPFSSRTIYTPLKEGSFQFNCINPEEAAMTSIRSITLILWVKIGSLGKR